MPRPPFIPWKNPVPIVQEAGWAPGQVWTGAENLAPHRDSIPGPSSPQRCAIPTELSRPTAKNQVPTDLEDGYAPKAVRMIWRRGKSLAHPGIQTLDRPACSIVIILTQLTRLPHYLRTPIIKGVLSTFIVHVYYSIRCSLKDAVRHSGHTASNDRVIMVNGVEKGGRGLIKKADRDMPGGNEENHKSVYQNSRYYSLGSNRALPEHRSEAKSLVSPRSVHRYCSKSKGD